MEASTSSSSSNNNINNNNNELFICFASRLSSSMKLSSASTNSNKSLLSPGRAQISLSASLSRRLRTSASLKSASALGQASPMFPNAPGKKRSSAGCASAFDNPEPSSPKVTCIGQVRVKSKSKKKKRAAAAAAAAAAASASASGLARSRSSHHHRRSLPPSGGEASFRRNEDGNGGNGKWICEALRTFGSELNCFTSPCWSSNDNSGDSCNKREDEQRRAAEKSGRSCGAVFGRWMVAVQDGGDGKGRREIQLVVSAEKENNDDIKNNHNCIEDNGGVEVVERSSSLKRRVFEGIEFRDLEAKVAAEDAAAAAAGTDEKARVSLCVPPKNALLLMRCRSDPVKMAALASRFWESPSAATADPPVAAEVDSASEEEQENSRVTEEAENNSNDKNNNEAEVLEKIEQVFDVMEAVVLVEDEENLVHQRSTQQQKLLEESDDDDIGLKLLFEANEDEEEEEKAVEEDCPQPEAENKKVKVDQLPDCLLLMMCEPKLSMEVSKETWVCTTDFVRWLPDRRRPPPNPKKIPPKPHPKPAVVTVEEPNPAKVVLLQPPRSSCSAVSVAKLAGTKPYEPFVLTRCKSEPVKSAAAAKLAAAATPAVPESCLWKNRKLEPHHHHRLGVGGAAAGIGF